MSNTINLNKKHCKDCPDWAPLQDGTKTGDTKYCDLSLQCKQIGMKSDWHKFRDIITGEESFDYFCTGMYATEENKYDDVEIS